MFSNLSRVDTLAGAVIAAAWGAASQLGVPAAADGCLAATEEYR
eukprot:COSAG04_NODE_19987_length_403_cov_0.960526_1_plen_43_part_10